MVNIWLGDNNEFKNKVYDDRYRRKLFLNSVNRFKSNVRKAHMKHLEEMRNNGKL